MPLYAVAKGYQTGIFLTWAECEKQVKGFKGAKFKKFQTEADANDFIEKERLQGIMLRAPSTSTSSIKQEQVVEANHINTDVAGSANALHIKQEANLDASLLYDDVQGDQELLLALDALQEYPSTVTNKQKINKENSVSKVTKRRVKIGRYTFTMDEEGFVDAYIGGHYENIGSWNCMAGLGVYFGDKHSLNIAESATGRMTRNVADIEAAIYAIKTAIDVGIKKLCLHTASEFLLKAITTWIFAWKSNGWRNKNGKVVQNRKEFIKLDALLNDDRIAVKWHNIKGNRGALQSMQEVEKLALLGTDEYLELHPKKDLDNSFDYFDGFF